MEAISREIKLTIKRISNGPVQLSVLRIVYKLLGNSECLICLYGSTCWHSQIPLANSNKIMVSIVLLSRIAYKIGTSSLECLLHLVHSFNICFYCDWGAQWKVATCKSPSMAANYNMVQVTRHENWRPWRTSRKVAGLSYSQRFYSTSVCDARWSIPFMGFIDLPV